MTAVNGKTLTTFLGIAKRLTGKSSMPAVNSVRIGARNGVLTIDATDCETSIRLRVPCKGELSPSLLPLSTFAAVVAGVKASDVSLARPEGPLGTPVALVAGARSFRLAVSGPVEEYPDVFGEVGRTCTDARHSPDNPCAYDGCAACESECVPPKPAIPAGPSAVFTGTALAKFESALSFVLLATSSDVTRYNMSGVNFEGAELVATDSHRLHAAKIPHTIPGTAESRLVGDRGWSTRTAGRILAKPGVQALLDVLNRFDAQSLEARVFTAEVKDEKDTPASTFLFGVVAANGVTIEIRSRAIDGAFPPFKSVTPVYVRTEEDAPVEVELDAESWLGALKLSRTVVSDRIGGVEFKVNGAIELRSQSPETGEFAEAVIGRVVHGELHIGMKASYAMEACEALGGTVRFRATDDCSPMLFDSGKGSDRYALLMPMKL